MTREEFRKAKWSYGTMVKRVDKLFAGESAIVTSVDFDKGMVTVYIDPTLQLVCDYEDLEIVKVEQ